jgi:hypothetical protein
MGRLRRDGLADVLADVLEDALDADAPAPDTLAPGDAVAVHIALGDLASTTDIATPLTLLATVAQGRKSGLGGSHKI